jgi:hypothetical protein
MHDEKITFKPLHDGLGFHPFSEGLPYAPQTKTESKPASKHRSASAMVQTELNRGTAATSAGIPSFAIPSMPKTTRQLQQQKNPVASVQPTAQPIQQTKPAQMAPIRTRFFAYLLDTVIHVGFWVTISLMATLVLHLEIDGNLMIQNWKGFLGFFLFSQWFFIGMQESLFENSMGKTFFGLEFRQNRKSFLTSSLFLRSIVFMLGSILLVGFFLRPQDYFAEIQMKKS